MTRAKRILYVQYTNPGAYPPLHHSSRMLARAGWDVLCLGTGAFGTDELQIDTCPGIRVRRLRFKGPGLRQKLHYALFCFWCLAWAVRFRPSWVYASDMLACPAALLIRMLCQISLIYHEHDAPAVSNEQHGLMSRFQLALRRVCARVASACVLPNAERARIFSSEQGVANTVVIWNCPARDEIGTAREPLEGPVRLLYHGSLSPELLPLTAIDALAELPQSISLELVGYETAGTRGYINTFREHAAERGVAHRVNYRGPLSRRELMEFCRNCDAGLAVFSPGEANPNLTNLVGASNKVFDYLAGGLPVILPASSEWDETLVKAGYGIAARSTSAHDLADAIRGLCTNPSRLRAMGEAGRRKIRTEWNYEQQFKPVWQLLHSAP